ncbi:MAG TPA: hypothetical protein VHC22_10660 [Pirellulales bacterium]|nr:hypothetical protein [Pirellulales bacterium]
MPRPQFTLRALLVLVLVVGAFFGGIELGAKREQKRLASDRSELKAAQDALQRTANTVQSAKTTLDEQERRVLKEQGERAKMLNERERRLAEKAK